MKTNAVHKLVAATAVAVITVIVALVPLDSYGQKGAGAEALMKGHPIKTSKDIDSLEPGDLVAMACPKCRTVTFNYVEQGRGVNKPVKVGEKHTCPGCKTTIETVGLGKASKDEIKHVCHKCGSDLAYCCSLKKGELTRGMKEAAGAGKTDTLQKQK